MEFTGTFTGHTISGYAFSQMHGDMIALTDSTSLEINHFVPSGITADFASDDAIFNKILQSLVLPTSSLTPSPTPTSVQTATSSGY
jgi:hypothetical protein